MDRSSEDAAQKLQFSFCVLFERNPPPVWVYDARTLRMLAGDEAALAEYGYSLEEFVRLTMHAIQPDVGADTVQESLQRPAGEQMARRQAQYRSRHGKLLEVETITEEIEFDGIRARMMLATDLSAQCCAFMVVREAIESALRHPGASAIYVSLSGTSHLLQLEISDNGVGLATGAELKTGHLGILGMHERAHAVGAQVAVESDPAQGTRVMFSWQPSNDSVSTI